MKDKLKQYLRDACAKAEPTQKNQELQEEILANLYAKYDDFLQQGFSEEEAYRKTIENIGDLSSLLETPVQPIPKDPERAKKEKPREEKQSPAQKIFATVTGIFWALICVAYFGYSFLTGNWESSWLIFVYGGLLVGVGHGIFSLIIGKRRVRSIVKLVICTLLLTLLFGTNAWLMNEDMNLSLGSYSLVYDDEHYDVGEVDLPSDTEIRNLEIDWLAGSVTVDYWEEDYISVRETSNDDLERSRQLRYSVSGNTLRVKAQKSKWFGFQDPPAKNLTVYLPMGTQLNQLTVSGVSATLAVENVSALDAELTSVSGSVDLLNVTLEEAQIDTVSGKITLNGDAKEVQIDTVSGDLRLTLTNEPLEIEIDSVSASTTLMLPADIAGYSVEFDSVSGVCKLPDQKQFRDDYTYGNGATEIAFDSVSGNLTILHP